MANIYGIQLDKINDYFDLQDNDAWDIIRSEGSGFWAFWLEIDNLSGNTFQYFFSNNAFNATDAINIFTTNSSNAFTARGPGSDIATSNAMPLPTGYIFVVGQYNSSNSKLEITFCQEGGSADRSVAANSSFGDFTSANWNFGRRQDGNSDRYYGGKVFSIVKGSGYLTDADIEALASDFLNYDPTDNAIFTPEIYFPMNEGTGTTITDTQLGLIGTGIGFPGDDSQWVLEGQSGSGITITVTETLNSFLESSTLSIETNVSLGVTETLNPFSDSSVVNVGTNVIVAITEVLGVFSDSSVVDVTPASSGISLIDWTSNNTDNDPSMVLNVPTGTIDGDVILFLSQTDGNDGFESPTGFTALNTENTSASSTMVTAYRVASSEPASYVITHANSASERAIGYFASYRNVDTSNPIDQTTANNGGSSTNGVLTPLTPTNDDSMVVSFIGLETGNDGNPIISSWPSSLVEIADNVNGPPGSGASSSSGSFAEELQTTAAEVSGNIAISVASTTWCTTLISLNPIVSGVTTTVTETFSSFTDSSIINVSPAVSIEATVTEVLNSFSDSSMIEIIEPINVALNVTEILSAFNDSSSLNVSINVSVNITEVLNSFLDGSNVTIAKDIAIEVTEVLASFIDNSVVRMPTSWIDKPLVTTSYTIKPLKTTTYTNKPPEDTDWTDKD